MKAAIFVNLDKKDARRHLEAVKRYLTKKSVKVVVQKRDGEKLLNKLRDEELKSLDICLVLGGDGTVLSACRQVAPLKIPVLAIHLGGFGFLTEVEPKALKHLWQKLEQEEYILDRRMMLKVTIGSKKECYYALNDAVVTQGVFSRAAHFKIFVSSKHLAEYSADGILVATPTGSTAYNLSALGPLVHPSLSLFVLNPICAHTLYARPIVVSSKEKIAIQVEGKKMPFKLTLDGQEGVAIEAGDHVLLEKAPFTADLIRFQEDFFYRKLKEKLRWGGHLDA